MPGHSPGYLFQDTSRQLEPSKGGWDTGAFQQEEEEQGGPGKLPALSTLVRQTQEEGWREGGLPRPTLIIMMLYGFLLPFVLSLSSHSRNCGDRGIWLLVLSIIGLGYGCVQSFPRLQEVYLKATVLW